MQHPPVLPALAAPLRRVLLTLALGFVGAATVGACEVQNTQFPDNPNPDDVPTPPPAECKPESKDVCYDGPEGTAGRGLCRQGEHVCDADARWGACAGQVVPTTELCNRKDDDCDGVVDNDFERDGAVCFIGAGACKTQGVWHCSEDGKEARCDAPAPRRAAEVCNGQDDDCDGEIDNGALPGTGAACNSKKPGVCAAGTKKCLGGQIQCVATRTPDIEVCNGQDDDCDGKIDNSCLSEAEAAKLRAQRGQ